MSEPKFQPGDRVHIYRKLPKHWNRDGLMDHWLDRIVTIDSFVGNTWVLAMGEEIPEYRIVEDGHEWVWREDCLEFIEEMPALEEADLLTLLEVM